MKLFFRLLRFSKPYHHYIPEYVVYVVFYTIFGLLNFVMIIPLLDFLFKDDPINGVVSKPEFSFTGDYFQGIFRYYAQEFSAGDNQKFMLLVYITIILILVTLLKNFFGFMSQKVLARMRVNLVKKIRNSLFSKLTNTSLSFFHKKQKGQLLSTMSSDLSEIENTVVTSVQILFRDPLTIIATFITLFIISKELTFFTLLFFPLSGYVINTISRGLRKRSGESQTLLGSLMSYTDEMITGNRVIKIFNAEGFVQNQYQNLNDKYTKVMKKIVTNRELASPLSEVMGVTVIAIIIVYGGHLVLSKEGGLTASMFLGYLGLYFSILNPAKNIGQAIANLQRGLVSGQRVWDILDEKDEITDSPNALTTLNFSKNIALKNVSFAYQNEVEVLTDFNLIIEKGKTIALVGESGAGKSTVADLIPRFYDVTKGSIEIDGVNIREVKLDALRSQMSMVTQEAILFNDSVFNNIAFGAENVPLESVVDAAKVANAHEFILSLEEGYETMIGDRGMRLSGGQRQRLTIARAILKNAPIIIMDEATSALDTESERLVQDAINKLTQNRTSIIIAHRLSTIQHADEIIVMHKGQIVERGNHDHLILENGYYKRLVDMQKLVKSDQ
ncbi:MAG: ABC transporter ATP-binding protein [Saprospiraceae bacterium]|nr:ABC transporter ATP-binding protein [Candidatus Brachybacter algidus]